MKSLIFAILFATTTAAVASENCDARFNEVIDLSHRLISHAEGLSSYSKRLTDRMRNERVTRGGVSLLTERDARKYNEERLPLHKNKMHEYFEKLDSVKADCTDIRYITARSLVMELFYARKTVWKVHIDQ